MISRNTKPKPETIYLKPEEMAFCQSPTVVSTVLGSCLSITMHHQRSGFGAICHAFLPQCPCKNWCRETNRARCPKKYTYVDCVLPEMMNRFHRCGYQMQEVEIKIFGGANSLTETLNSPSVGSLNIAEAMEIVKRQRLRPKVADVGGRRGRKIRFFSHTGEVQLKRLNRQLLQEHRYQKGFHEQKN